MSYLDYTRYAMQLDCYLEHFDRERIRVVASEELRHNRRSAVRRSSCSAWWRPRAFAFCRAYR